MDKSRWTRDELAVCARVYRRSGSEGAEAALAAGGWTRSIAAIRNKMRKLGVPCEAPQSHLRRAAPALPTPRRSS